MHIIVGNVTCCSVLLKTDIGCLIIKQVFRGKVSECMLRIGVNSVYQKSAPNNPSCTDGTSHINLPTCNDTLWTNKKNLLFWEFKCPMKWNQSSPLNRMSVSSALHPKNIAIHKLQSCFIIFVPEFANHNCLMLMINAEAVLNFLLMMQKGLSAVPAAPMICLQMSPIYHQFHLVFCQQVSSACSLTV